MSCYYARMRTDICGIYCTRGFVEDGKCERFREYKSRVIINTAPEGGEQRNREIFRCGAMPFSQLERDFSEKKTEYSKEWRAFERTWQRPAATVRHMKAEAEYWP